MTQRPVLVEPTDMPDFPEYGIDDGQHRSHQLLRRQVIGEATGARARIAKLSGKLVGGGAARRPVYKSLVHADRSYHTGAFIVTVGKPDNEPALGADPAPARTSRSHRISLRRSRRRPDDCSPRVAQRRQHPHLPRTLSRPAADRGFE